MLNHQCMIQKSVTWPAARSGSTIPYNLSAFITNDHLQSYTTGNWTHLWQDPGGPHDGHMNLVILVANSHSDQECYDVDSEHDDFLVFCCICYMVIYLAAWTC